MFNNSNNGVFQMNNYDKYYKLAIETAKKHNVSRGQATKVFLEAYNIHKSLEGSFKYHHDYHKKMNERYEFMYQEVVKFCEERTIVRSLEERL